MSKAAAPALILAGVGAFAIYKLFPSSAVALGLRKAVASTQTALAGAKTSPAIADGTKGQANPYVRTSAVDTTVVDIAASYPIDTLRSPVAPDLGTTYARQAVKSAGDIPPVYGEGNDEFNGL